MHKITYIITTLIIVSLMATTGCDSGSSDSEPTATELQSEVLKNTGNPWVLSTVTKDDLDVTGQFEGFTLTFEESTYTTTNSLPSVWATSGTWEFNNDNPNSILRDDVVVISINSNNNHLTLTFTITELNNGGRTESINGEYQFNLVNQ